MKNLNTVAEQLFNEIRGRFPSVEIGDAEGNVVNEPQAARFYDFDFETNGKKLGKVSVSLDENNGVVIMFNKNFIENQYGSTKADWYGFLKNIRTFAKKRLLNFEVRDINRTNLTKRDYKFLAANRRGEQTMAESRMYGSAKTSFQKIGNAKLSIKHTGAIQEGSSRTQKIGAIYIENTDGEKFKYPFKHLSGARALAVHVSEGGHPYDDFGKYISGLSEELSNLRKFKQYMARSSVMAESLSEHMDTVNERVALVKKEIQNLQKPSYYINAFENFVPKENAQVPEDIANNWIDQLTVKQFNEELKDVFPYIYNLVSETTRTKELSFEDIIAEQAQNFITYQVQPGDTITSIVGDMNAEGIATTVDQVMMDNKGVVDSKGNVNAGTVLKISEPSTQAPTASPRPQPRITNIGAGGVRELGPDGRPTGSTRGIDPALNYGESIEKTIDKLMGQFGESEEEDQLSSNYIKNLEIKFGDKDLSTKVLIKLKAEMVRLRSKDLVQLVKADIPNISDAARDEFKNRRARGLKGYDDAVEGNAYAHAVRQAKMDGKKKGDKVKGPDGDEITLEKENKIPLGEFILSYFDRESGQFPKGPTAVLTMVEKEYGDQYVRPASKFIERINQRVSEIMGYKDPDLTENPEQDLNQQILGFARYLMGMDRRLGYKASDLMRQHPGQPKMALQALQSDPEIAKLWQNYSNMNQMGRNTQDMNTRETFSLETASVDDAMNLLKTNSTGIFNRLKSQLMPQIQTALRSGTLEEKALAQQWMQIFKAAENLGESTDNKLKEALSSNDVSDLMGAIRDLIVRYSDEASNATGDSAVDVAADDAARQEPPTTRSDAENNTQTPITRNTGYNFNNQEAANAYLNDTQPGDVATVGRNKEKIVRDIDDNGNPVWTPEQDYTGRNANKQPAAQPSNTRTQQGNRNNNRNNNISGEPIPTYPSMQAAMQMIDYYQPGERVDINGQPHVRDIEPNGRKIYRPTSNESIELNRISALAGLT